MNEDTTEFPPWQLSLSQLLCIVGLKMADSLSVYVKNAGVRAWFTVTDIPVTNGVIHVIDGPIWLAYRTVEEVLIAEPEVM